MDILPGIKLFHEGQFYERKIRLPVFLSRSPDEPVDEDLQEFYKKALQAVNCPVFRGGQWSLCERTGRPDDASFQNLVAWSWVNDQERYLIVVNLSDSSVQTRVQVRWTDARGGKWRLIDLLSGVTNDQEGDEMRSSCLCVELGPWNCHFFQCLRANKI